MTRKEKDERFNALYEQVLAKEAELAKTNPEIMAGIDVLFDMGDLALAMQTPEWQAAHDAAVGRSVLRMEIDALKKQIQLLEGTEVVDEVEGERL